MKAVIAGYARSPFHFANKGRLAPVRPDDLASQVVKALLARPGLNAGGQGVATILEAL
jgi:acetyl-CoA acyltransferase